LRSMPTVSVRNVLNYRLPRLGLAFVCLAASLGGPVACTCSSDKEALEPAAKLCERRAKWTKRLRSKCTKCVSLAKAPPGCEAADTEYSARCVRAQRAKLDEKSCEPVFQCAAKCKPTECDCVARCFEGHPQCDRLAAAVDSCVADVCGSHCR